VIWLILLGAFLGNHLARMGEERNICSVNQRQGSNSKMEYARTESQGAKKRQGAGFYAVSVSHGR